MDLQEVRNTSLIEVGVWNTDRVMASNIANTIAKVYRTKRLSDLQETIDRALQQYTDEVVKQRKLVTEALTKLAMLRMRDKINDPDQESATAPISSPSGGSGDPQRAVAEQRMDVNKNENQLATIEKLKPEELINVYKQIGITDDTITSQLPILQQTVVEEANLLATGLGENHPKIKGLRARKVAINRLLADALESLRKTQATKLQYEKEKLAALRNQSRRLGRTRKREPESCDGVHRSEGAISAGQAHRGGRRGRALQAAHGD